jgi:ring-1,2-phenylacetyl-CoA epoxidase subunit PaaE
MSRHFHPLVIKEVRNETTDCVSVRFEIPDDLQSLFKYTQGQSLTVRSVIEGQEVRRTYSLCSSPLDNEWRVAIKRVDGGLFSSFAHSRLKAGDVLEVMQPVGRFNTPLDPANRKHYVAFAAGSGITPVLSLIKTTLATEPSSRFTLVYGNRTRSSIIFFEELEAIKNKYMDRFTLINILSREKTETPVSTGRIDNNKLTELSRLIPYTRIDEYFVCGPEEMIFTVRDFLEQQGVASRHIHFELFTTPGQQIKQVSTTQVMDTQAVSEVAVQVDGRTIHFNMPLTGDVSVLDAALAQGADLPYACKGGVCCTCKARVVEGAVSMDVHWGLEPEEIEQGYILTCQSHPTTDKLVVDFDSK